MTTYLAIVFFMFLYLGISWSKNGYLNLFIKITLISMLLWTLLLLLNNTNLLSILTQGQIK